MSADEEESALALPEDAPERSLLTQGPVGGRPRLNPLVEAALGERLQFDGDAPELRTGPLPPGVSPAVPVATQARNPVAVGRMLRDASQQVQEALLQHEQSRLLEAIPTAALDLLAKHGELVSQDLPEVDALVRGSGETDLPGYRRGEMAKPVAMPSPSGADLARISYQEARQMTWAAISTTQGRRTMAEAILTQLEKAFKRWRFQVVPAEGGATLAETTWSVSISANQLQPGFSFVDVAAMAMGIQLLDALADKTPRLVGLQVETRQRLDERSVGWIARVTEVTPC